MYVRAVPTKYIIHLCTAGIFMESVYVNAQ